MKKISCIIPAYNECLRIPHVLKVVANHSLVDEIIVIDDCSTDNTAEMVSKFPKIKFIRHEVNRGKSQAIVTGLMNACHDTIMLIDADLVGLTAEDITNLIEPVQTNVADMSISLRRNAPLIDRWIGLDFISGERVIPKKLLEDMIPEIDKLPHFGLETWMNKLIISKKYRIKVVPWNNVKSPYKYEKHGKKGSLITSIGLELPMYRDIFKIASPIRILIMIRRMLSLRV